MKTQLSYLQLSSGNANKTLGQVGWFDAEREILSINWRNSIFKLDYSPYSQKLQSNILKHNCRRKADSRL